MSTNTTLENQRLYGDDVAEGPDYRRQTLMFNPRNFEKEAVNIIGVGNIGSHTAITLARMGIRRICMFDPDRVEAHNLTSQNYSYHDLKGYKARVLRERIYAITNSRCNAQDINEKFEDTVEKYKNNLRGMEIDNRILVVAVDSMKARKSIAETLKKYKFKPKLIVDGRVGGSQLEIYVSNNVTEWQKTFADNPAEDPCGGRFICHVSVIIGGLITNKIRKFLMKEPYEKSIVMDVNTLQIIKNVDWSQ